MNCSWVTKNRSAYLDGELQSAESAAVEMHLVDCQRCAEELEHLKLMNNAFAAAQRYSAPQDFSRVIMGRIAVQEAKGFNWQYAVTRVAGAAVCMLVLFAGVRSGDTLLQALAQQQSGNQVAASLALDAFSAHPPQSLGNAYFAILGESQ